MKYSILIITICLLSCKQEKSKFDNNIGTKHDTVIVVKKDTFAASVESHVQVLLMEYYSAGWMDGTNKLIDLYNANQFTASQIEKQRQIYWAKMKQQLASKK